jgi:hypothetical protein
MPMLGPLLIVSAAYGVAFLATDRIVTPVQIRFLPEITQHASLIFLPHGVRVLTAWLYGWKSLPLLVPASLATALAYHGIEGVNGALAMTTILCAGVAALAFSLVARFGHDLRWRASGTIRWNQVLAVGVVASVFNSTFTAALNGTSLPTALVMFIGDVIGLGVCLVILMFTFRTARLRGWF